MRRLVPRNAPCPCGSGKKYKHCCHGKAGIKDQPTHGRRTVMIIAAVALAGLGVFAWTNNRPRPAPSTTAPASPGNFQIPLLGDPATAGPTPQPYEYDSANNRHWDPGHGHWHNGQPPAAATGSRPTTTPQPYEYDSANNRHWDPGHGHWHNGPPPATAAGSQPTTAPPSQASPLTPTSTP